MGIAHFIREIGRGKQGARNLTREQACELMTAILNGTVEPVAMGAFCIAMRIKGETPDELMGFLDAVHERLQLFTNPDAQPVVVLPSYNGARRLPLLTPLLAKLLARQGHAVLVHGCSSEDNRVNCEDVLAAIGISAASQVGDIVKGDVVYAHTQLLSSALWSMLQVRRETGLRNSAHSLVKLMNPVHGPCLLVTSYTHPDYAASMLTSLQAMAANAVLLRGTEGEPVADLRKIPVMQCLLQGRPVDALEIPAQVQHVTTELPLHLDVQQTADYIEKILNGHIPVPPPVQAQADLISRLSNACSRKPIEGNAS